MGWHDHPFLTYTLCQYDVLFCNDILRRAKYRKQGKYEGFDSCDPPSNLTQIWFKSSIIQPVWPWNLTEEKNTAPLLYYAKLCASFETHWWIQNGITVPKRTIQVKIYIWLSRVTFKLDRWPWKSIHLFHAALSFLHHFIAISNFKLDLQSGNSQFRSKSTICLAVWPWYLSDDIEKQYGTSP